MKRIHLLVLLSALALPFAAASASGSGAGSVVVGEVYAAGGNSGAAYANDYVEVFNRGAGPVAVDGWTLQYASASSTTWQSTALSGTIPAGGHYLVQLASGGANGAALPAPDATGSSNLAVTGGKVAVVDNATALSCGASPGTCSAVPAVEDLVGYGSAADYEGSGAAPAPSATTALARAGGGCTDSDDNAADFGTAAPDPQNSSAAAGACSSSPPPSGSSASASVDVDVQPLLSIALDRATLSFPAAVPSTTPAPLPEHVTVTSNDPSGYTLTIHRTAFSPHDLPLGIGVGGGGLAAVPIAPAPDLLLATDERAQRGRRRRVDHECRLRLAAAGRPGRPLHGDADLHGDRPVSPALAMVVLGVAAVPIPGAAAGRGIGLSASPLRLTLTGVSAAAITMRNPGRRPLLVDVSRAGFARSPRGKPRVRPARGAAAWLRLRPRRVRIAPGAKAILHVAANPRRRASPGDHPALVLLTTRPLGVHRVRVRLRVGVIVVLHVRGRIVRRLDARALTVRRAGARRLLELRLVNRGNVTERLGGDRLRLVLVRHGRTLATLHPRRREFLPHSAGIAEFTYHGRIRGDVFARIELRPLVRGLRRSFRVRL